MKKSYASLWKLTHVQAYGTCSLCYECEYNRLILTILPLCVCGLYTFLYPGTWDSLTSVTFHAANLWLESAFIVQSPLRNTKITALTHDMHCVACCNLSVKSDIWIYMQINLPTRWQDADGLCKTSYNTNLISNFSSIQKSWILNALESPW